MTDPHVVLLMRNSKSVLEFMANERGISTERFNKIDLAMRIAEYDMLRSEREWGIISGSIKTG